MVDFEAMLASAEEEAPIEPRELHGQLKKAPGYGYLRDVQGQVLTAWHAKRADKDIVLKVNTGSGKTIDGLIILQSYLNAGEGPAVYVTPSNHLKNQVIAEADRLGLATTTDVDSASYLNSEAIAVINAYQLVNGRSKFSDRRTSRPRAPIGAVVIDDAHAAIATTRQQLSLSIPRGNEVFSQLLSLFADDMKAQSSDAFLDVEDDRRGTPARVPFRAWRAKVEQARTILRTQTGDKQPLYYDWPAVSEVLPLCRVVFSNSEVTVTPFCPPIDHVTSFMEAKHRVFLTATLADDSVLVTDFGADANSVASPITPVTAGDIGERMILAPQEINPSIDAESIREEIVKLSDRYNTVVLVPSGSWAKAWEPYAAIIADKDNIDDTVDKLRSGRHIGLVVLVNRYDGIDLPNEACRVLVIDGLPEAFSPEERLDSLLVSADSGIDARQVQRIEQGMGRGVRSNEDHCVVFLLGPRLSQLTVDPRTASLFSPATQAQLKLSRKVAAQMDSLPLAKIIETAQQALDRREGWVRLALNVLRNISPAPGRVSRHALAEREAFVLATNGDYQGAKEMIANAIDGSMSDAIAGKLLELQAVYTDFFDPELAQQTLTLARSRNTNVTKPLGGLTYTPLDGLSPQAKTCSERLIATYSTPAALRLDVEAIIEDLVFDELKVEQFEEAFRKLGFFIGLGSQRPEHDVDDGGPDNLWALGDNNFWVIEAKTGARSSAIGKRDVAQLAESMLWFGCRYDPQARPTPVMVHQAVPVFKNVTPPPGMRIITAKGLGELAAALRSFAAALSVTGWLDAESVGRLLVGHGLSADNLLKFTVPQRGVKS